MATSTYVPRLKERYRSELREELRSTLDAKNIMEVPTLEKIVINMGVGEAPKDAKQLEGALSDLTTISGQKPTVRRARKSIATFKIRGDRMWDFFDRLVAIVLPRIRDFRGLNPRSFDGHGNYTFGLTEQLVFPEIDYDDIDTTRGMDVTIVTTAKDDEGGRALLKALGLPLRDQQAPSA
jgi:large subunit ribosomal protein L5